MFRTRNWAIILLSLCFSCSNEDSANFVPSTKYEPVKSTPHAKKILVFGDSGTGDANQFTVAKGMQVACRRNGCDFALMLGDNFYESGVKNVDDPQFQEKFEIPYGPLKIDFYAILGNHDYAEAFTGEFIKNWFGYGNAKAQIEYSKKSPLWKMPSEYYSFTEGDIQFFGLDTTRFTPAQLGWLKLKLKESKARFKIVYAHHPIRTYGLHAKDESTIKLAQDLLPVLCEYKVDAYLAGHDHSLQIINEKTCPLLHVISGAAAKNDGGSLMKQAKAVIKGIDYLKGEDLIWARNGLGFVRLEITYESLKVIGYNENGERLYEHVKNEPLETILSETGN